MDPTSSCILPTRVEDDSWSYRGEYSSGYTHRFHTYPAMMLPQVARRLITQLATDGKTILDPFCGSGSVLVEANVAGCNVWGFDLNPLAILIARVKTTPLAPEILQDALARILIRAEVIRDPEMPEFFNVDFWFKPLVLEALSRLRSAIAEIEDSRVREFFAVVFSEVVRLASNSRTREFKLYRYPPEQLATHNPDCFRMFKERASRNIDGMQAFCPAARRDRFVRPMIHNTMLPSGTNGAGPRPVTVHNSGVGAGFPGRGWAPPRRGDLAPTPRTEQIPRPESVDLVLTSPPYGDSRTTVAYGQFSRLSLQFLGQLCGYDFAAVREAPQELDRRMLGGTPAASSKPCLSSPTLERTVQQISAKDAPRARDVIAFYADFSVCLRHIVSLVAPGGTLCFVVGNRRVKGVQLDTDYIIAEMGTELGLVAEGVTMRSIPAKRMPLRNSPSNRPGETENTMHREYILVLRRGE